MRPDLWYGFPEAGSVPPPLFPPIDVSPPGQVGNDPQTADCEDIGGPSGGTATYTVPANTVLVTVPKGEDEAAYKAGANALALALAISTLTQLVADGDETCEDPCGIYFVEGVELEGGGDNFECYDVGANLDGLSAGTAFTGAWNVVAHYVGVMSWDTFEGVVGGTNFDGLALGQGWGGAWSVVELTPLP